MILSDKSSIFFTCSLGISKSWFYKVSFMLLLLLRSIFSDGHEIRYESIISGEEIFVNQTIELEDQWYSYMQTNSDWIDYSSDPWPFTNPNSLRFVNYSSRGYIGLHWSGNSGLVYNNSWQLEITVLVEGYNSNGVSLGTSTEVLEIDYIPGNKVEYEDWSLLGILGAHRLELSVTGISIIENGVSTSYPTLSSEYGDVELSAYIEVERYFMLSPSEVTSFIDHQSGDGTGGQTWDNTVERTVDIYWNTIVGAEEYDLELLFVSDAFIDGVGNSPLSEDWSSATRITLSDVHYKMEMVYETGVLFYRVRGVGRHGLDMLDRREAAWSSAGNIVVDAPKAYTPTKNWTYSATYAEEGKRSEVVSFVDGIGRGRQSVTKTTTSETVMVSESHYDYEGRASLSVMPSVIVGSKSLGFYKNYSLYGDRDELGNSIVVDLSPEHYDNDAAYTDGNTINPLLTGGGTAGGALNANGGSARYYSPENPNALSGMEAYVPDAGGYTYSVVQYDSRGRVKKASGVGDTHRMGSGHEITTNYGIVFQEEIDKLFGTDVGYAEHYRKKVIEDANGQRTLSYETLTGQVIATAIIGEGPEEADGREILKDLDALTYAYPDSRLEEVNLTNYNIYYPSQKAWVIERQFSVDEPGVYTFNYNINPQEYIGECLSGDCNYEVDFHLYDEYLEEIPLTGNFPISLNSNTNTPDPYVTFSHTFGNGQEGSYTIVKSLRLVNTNLTEAQINMVANGETPCYDPEDYIVPVSMEDCVVEIVELEELPMAVNCGLIVNLMKSDVSPNGQYFDLWLANSISGTGIVGDLTSLVSSNIGNYISFSDLEQNWQTIYADELIKLHPEYCYNQWCSTLNESLDFDIKFQRMDSDVNGYMNSCGNGTHKFLTGTDKDPFYALVGTMSHPNGGTYTSQMYNILCTNNNIYGDDIDTRTVDNFTDYLWQGYQSLYLEAKQAQVELFISNNITCLPEDSGDGIIDDTHPDYGGLYRRVVIGQEDVTNNFDELYGGIDTNGDGDLSTSELTNYQNYFNTQYNICGYSEATIPISCTTTELFEGNDFIHFEYDITSFTFTFTGTGGTPINHQVSYSNYTLSTNSTEGGNCSSMLDAIIAGLQAEFDINHNGITVYYQSSSSPYGSYDIVVRIPEHMAANYTGWTISSTQNNQTAAFTVRDCEHSVTRNCLCEEISIMQDLYDENWIDELETAYNAQFPEGFTKDGAPFNTPIDYDWFLQLESACNELESNIDPDYDVEDFINLVPDELDCWTPGSPCEDEAIALSNFYTNAQQQSAIDAAIAAIENEYIASCTIDGLSMIDEFTLTYTTNARHFMLYYYDQVGNLTQTVPPTGVRMITDPTDLNQVQNLRGLNNGTSLVPNHRLETTYEYNTFNQLTKTNSPDGGKVQMFYDIQGRLRFSVNAEQIDPSNSNRTKSFNYIIYDALGRAIESGVSTKNNGTITLANLGASSRTGQSLFPKNNNNFTRTEITWTYYDDVSEIPTSLQSELLSIFPNGQKETRGRVVMTSSSYTGDEQNPDAISAYTYDIVGNVPDLYRYDKLTDRWHHFEYDFDLLTSNVNEMVYQRGELDEIAYKYYYDADNRLVKSQSSENGGYLWHTEEKLFYYVNGMLARRELGEDKVQGIDYTYTINGWYKGVNSATLDENLDMGRDGLNTLDAERDYLYADDLNANVNRDAFGFSLHFFDGDYQAIGRNTTVTNPTLYLTTLPDAHKNSLYNGNIGDMVVGLTKPQVGGSVQAKMEPQWTSYKYDQLNRIRDMVSSTNYNSSTNTWSTQANGYTTAYNYDGNGNILTLVRKKADPNTVNGRTIDNLTYYYDNGGSSTSSPSSFVNNQLRYVDDGVTNNSLVDYDIDDQNPTNYEYDEIGNLIKDEAEEIANIIWRADGKMYQVIRTSGSQKPNLEFMYDEGGTRIAKIVKPVGSSTWNYTHYVRDVSGNTIATYEQEKAASAAVDLTLKEHTLYGSKRLGILKQNINVSRAQVITTGLVEKDWNRLRGNKYYELANHLGNVLNGVSDLKIRIGDGSGNVAYYEADVHFVSDYYPFGMQMKDRTFAAQEYTYGFNGQEQDGELMDGAVVFKYRIHDPRIGKFLSVDPLAPEYPWYTPYQFAGNKVISHRELEGLEELESTATLTSSQEKQLTEADENFTSASSVTIDSKITSVLYYHRTSLSIENPYYIYKEAIIDNESGEVEINQKSYIGSFFNFIPYINYSGVAARFIRHYEKGNGGMYQLNNKEILEIGVSQMDLSGGLSLKPFEAIKEQMDMAGGFISPSQVKGIDHMTNKMSNMIKLSDKLSEMEVGDSEQYNVNILTGALKGGTLGNYTFAVSGTLTKMDDNGHWTFEGTGTIKDTYDFNLSKRANQNRSSSGVSKTTYGYYLMSGTKFPITSKTLNVTGSSKIKNGKLDLKLK